MNPLIVTVINTQDLRDRDTEITKGADGSFYLHLVLSGGDSGSGTVIVAKCKNAERLGRWALDAGSRNVRHSYDLTSAAIMVP